MAYTFNRCSRVGRAAMRLDRWHARWVGHIAQRVIAVSLLVGIATSSRSALAQEPATSAAAVDRPNVVVVMLDDLGFSDLGCYGATVIETPTIDRLASRGLRLSQFYNTSKCHSSRICLLSGLYPFQAGNHSMSRAVTFAELLKSAGYSTHMVGKWHLDGEPTDRGFEHYFGHLSGATNFFRGDDTFRLNGERWSDFGDEFYTTDANTDFAIRFVDEALDEPRPFLLYMAYNAPHYPLHARREDFLKYRGRFRDVGWDQLRRDRYQRQRELGIIDTRCRLAPRPEYIPAWDRLSDDWRDWEDARMAAYAGMVDRIDQNLGRLIEFLDRRGVWENTLFLLCSDNGACPFERTRGRDQACWDPNSYWTYDVGWAHVGNTPFRWFKQNQHEGGIASPLIVHWPKGLRTPPGHISHQPAHLIDILPTVADVAGASYPTSYESRTVTPVQGTSLMPIFRGKQRAPAEWLYFLFHDNRAIRQGDWKLVSAEWGRWELYHLADDRSETRDLSAERPDKLEELRKLWLRVAREVDRVPSKLLRPVDATVPFFPPKKQSTYEYRAESQVP